MATKPTPPGTAYRTSKDLRSLFTTFPRADDGSEAEMPDKIADTIVPIIDLGAQASFDIRPLQVFQGVFSAVAPAQTVTSTAVPVGRRWVVWRMQASFDDTTDHQLWLGVKPAGILIHWAVMSSRLVTKFEIQNRSEPIVLSAGASIQALMDGPLVLGGSALSLAFLFSDFADSDVIPSQVTMGF